ncbi:uncharacterized protein Tco025E_09646 [Trypanosoma conorhini]|uniref:Secreted protein n=1 Tax=Trypanosoma conorhini TaxID=83891 RepID=A0A3R7R6I2_9TRYP|nr:uncharacterized protein Tco025E_09646 [Trypanosoma conorhini]RNE96801.1 hypothetical protein Tco025E_09646 [Trypanosoma conorhini]
MCMRVTQPSGVLSLLLSLSLNVAAWTRVSVPIFCFYLPLSFSFWLVVGVQPQRKPTTTAKEGTHVSNAWETRGRSSRCCGGALHVLRRRAGVGGGRGPPAGLDSPQRSAEGRRRHRRGHSEPLTARWRECASLCSTRSGATSWGFLRLKGGGSGGADGGGTGPHSPTQSGACTVQGTTPPLRDNVEQLRAPRPSLTGLASAEGWPCPLREGGKIAGCCVHPAVGAGVADCQGRLGRAASHQRAKIV